MENDAINRDYGYTDSAPTWSNQYIWPVLERVIGELRPGEKRCFEIGCGNGATADYLSEKGFDVTGVDPSVSGIEEANRSFPHLKLYEGSAYDDLAARCGRVDQLGIRNYRKA